MNIVLMTYTSFTTTAKLVEKLVERYRVPASINPFACSLIKSRVANVFLQWQLNYSTSSDFLDYIEVIENPDGSKQLNEVNKNLK